MDAKDLARRIREQLGGAGVSEERIAVDRAADSGEAAAQYQKACLLLGQESCQFRSPANRNYWEWTLESRAGGGHYGEVPEILPAGIEPYGEWFTWLTAAAQAGYEPAVADLLELMQWPPYVEDPEWFFGWCKFAAENDALTYVDEYGEKQPYSLLVGEIYLRGRVLYPSAKQWAQERLYKGSGVAFFDGKSDSESGTEGLPNIRSRNKVAIDIDAGVKHLKRAAQLGSKAALSRLASINLKGLSYGGRDDLHKNVKAGLDMFLQLESLGGYTMPFYTLSKDGNTLSKTRVMHTGPYDIATVYLHGAPGVPRNLEAATQWFTKSAELGNSKARERLQEILDHIETGKALAPAEKKNAKQKPRINFQIIANQGWIICLILPIAISFAVFALSAWKMSLYAGIAAYPFLSYFGARLLIAELPDADNRGGWEGAAACGAILLLTWAVWGSVPQAARLVLLASAFGLPFIPFVRRVVGSFGIGIVASAVIATLSFIVGAFARFIWNSVA